MSALKHAIPVDTKNLTNNPRYPGNSAIYDVITFIMKSYEGF